MRVHFTIIAVSMAAILACSRSEVSNWPTISEMTEKKTPSQEASRAEKIDAIMDSGVFNFHTNKHLKNLAWVTKDQMIECFGAPRKKNRTSRYFPYEEGGWAKIDHLYYNGLYARFGFAGAAGDLELLTFTSGDYRLKDGLKIGSSKDFVIEKLGRPDKITDLDKSLTRYTYAIQQDSSRYIHFEFFRSKVKKISLEFMGGGI